MAKLILKSLPQTENYLGIEPEYSDFWKSPVVIWPVAYERTTTWLKGTKNGPKAIIQASPNLEFYDEIFRFEPYRQGIATLPIKDEFAADENAALDEIGEGAMQILNENKFLITLGGEHSITPPLVRQFKSFYPDLTVLHFDAHADLRESYEGSKNNHACAFARVREICPFVSVGIRNYSVEEAELIQKENLNIFHAHEMHASDDWQAEALKKLSPTVYISFDLDYFDISLMPATGTPEPGGIDWYPTLAFLEKVFQSRKVVGLDVVEFRPLEHFEAPAFTAAKLVYKMIGLKYKTQF